MAVIAAHAVATKATAHAHSAHEAPAAAVPADEAALFASLLAEIGGAEEASLQTGKDAADPEKSLDVHLAAKKSKAAGKDDAADDTSAIVDAQAQLLSTQLAGLNATSPDDQSPKQSKTDEAADPVKPADAAKEKNGDKEILGRLLEAGTAKAAPRKDEPQKTAKKAPVSVETGADAKDTISKDAAAMVADAAETKPAKAAETKQADTVSPVPSQPKVADAVKLAAAATGEPVDTKADTAAKDAKTAKKDDAKDGSSQNQTPDKAQALAAAAGKTVRQNVASQSQQVRALPVHIEAQVAANQNGNGNEDQSGGKSGSAGTPAHHAKADSGVQPRADAVQPAPQATLNAAGTAPQPSPHTQTETGNIQPATAPIQPQANAPVVAASLQVAPQTAQMAAQMAAQPDIAALAIHIAAKSDDGNKQFDIRLDPPELGRVEVKLTIDDQGHAQAHLAVEKPQTLDMLQNDRSNLERALKDSGLALSQNGLNFSLKGQERQGGNDAPLRGRSRNLAVTAAIESASAATAISTNSFAAGNARLDIRV